MSADTDERYFPVSRVRLGVTALSPPRAFGDNTIRFRYQGINVHWES